MKTNTIKKIILFAMPIMASNLLNIIATIFGMYLVSFIGKEQLAAGALASSTYITLVTITATTLFAVGILVSHLKGQQEQAHKVGDVVINAFWVGVLLAIPCGLILWHGDRILHLFGQHQQLIAITTTYFHYAALALFAFIISLIVSQLYTGIGFPNFNLITSAIRLPFILTLSYILVLGKLGFPQMGLGGIMASMFWVQIIYDIVILIYIYFSEPMKKFCLFRNPFKVDPSLMKKIFKMGFPIGVQYGGEIGAMTVATYLMGFFGITALAASQIVSQYGVLMVMITMGLSQAVAILTSEAYGQHDFELVRQYLKSSMQIASLFFGVFLLVIVSVPHILISVFINVQHGENSQLLHLTTVLLMIGAVTLYIDSIRNMLSGTLRGLHNTNTPMRIGVVCLWLVSLPLCYIGGFLLHGGPAGLRIGFTVGFVIACFFLWKKTQALIAHNVCQLEKI